MAKIPKDLEATKSLLQTSLLPDEIRFDGLSLGQIPNIKFKDWDLTDSEKFPQLAAEKITAAEVVTGCGEGGVTQSKVDAPLSPRSHHNLCYLTVTMSST